MFFSFVKQLNPVTGEIIETVTDGLAAEFRRLTPVECESYPRAMSQLDLDECLVVERADGKVFAVPVDEAKAAGLYSELADVQRTASK